MISIKTRRVRAGQPVVEDTASAQQQPETRAFHRWGEPSAQEIAEASEAESGMLMLAYVLLALAVTGIAFTAAFVIAALR